MTNELWLTTQQAHDYVLSFIPPDTPEDHDCETCRVIRAIAAGFIAPPESSADTAEVEETSE